jgi:hypothetical protein
MRLTVIRPHHEAFQLERMRSPRCRDDSWNLQIVETDALSARLAEQYDRQKKRLQSRDLNKPKAWCANHRIGLPGYAAICNMRILQGIDQIPEPGTFLRSFRRQKCG